MNTVILLVENFWLDNAFKPSILNITEQLRYVKVL